MSAPREIPPFLQRKEPVAQFAYWSNGRLQILKEGAIVFLSPDDLQELRRFFSMFEETGHEPT